MKLHFRLAMALVAVLSARETVADTVLMKNQVSYDGQVIGRNDGLIRMRVGDRELALPAADVAAMESNNNPGQVFNYNDIGRLETEHDRNLTEKSGLEARQRAVVDEQLQAFFSEDERAIKNARQELLRMARSNNPYHYLEMRRREVIPTKLPPLLEVMFELNPEGMRETLEQAAFSPDEKVRAASLRCLGKLRDRTSLELMKRGMAEDASEIRIAAIHGAEAFGAREATPMLLQALMAGDPRVQNAARSALSTLWSQPGQPPLVFPQQSAWREWWNSKAQSVAGAWDPGAVEPLVAPGTVFQID